MTSRKQFVQSLTCMSILMGTFTGGFFGYPNQNAWAQNFELDQKSDRKEEVPRGEAPRGEAPRDEAEEIIVTANRLSTPESDVTSSVTVVHQEEIRRKQRTQLVDVLRDVPGLSVFSAGGPGKNTSIFIRGTNSQHTLVLLDGVEMNDPLGTARGYDFGNLSAQDIDRIEVVRGSQSVLYGSDAIGGVVQIFTKKGKGTPQGNVEAEYGTYRTYRLQGNVHGGSSGVNYYFGAGHQQTEGFPAADKNLGNQVNTGQALTTVTGDIGLEVMPKTTLQLTGRYSNSSFGLSASGGAPGTDAFGNRTGDDSGSSGTDRQGYGKLQVTSHLTDNWDSSLALSYSLNRRTTDHTPVPENLNESHSIYESNRIRGLFQNNFSLGDSHTLSLGLDSLIENGTSTIQEPVGSTDTGLKDKSMIVAGVFAQDQWLSESLFGTVGVRYDTYANIGSQVTYRIAPGYKIATTGTVLRGSLGTGFKVPSLFQRFSSFGDPALQSEQSLAYDIGVQQEFGRFSTGSSVSGSSASQATRLEVNYFRTDFNQLIDYSFTANRYANVGKAHAHGVEGVFRASPVRYLNLNLTYTYTFAVDDQTGLLLLRRPRHQLTGELSYGFSDRTQAGFTARYVGARDDIDAITASRLQMPDFTVLYLTAQHQISDSLQVFGRVDNLLNQAYQEIHGFGTPERSYFAGLRVQL